MNKSEFIEAVADKTKSTKAEAARFVDAIFTTDGGVIARALKKGDKIALSGFGTFSVKKRAARTGRNPQTGATIKIKASKNPSFKAGKSFKDAV